METTQEKAQKSSGSHQKSARSYNDIISYFNTHWYVNTDIKKSLERTRALDKALGSPSQKCDTLMVSGTNGKSLTIQFIVQLLKEEGLNVGAFYSPHILLYNERFAINQEWIQNKHFTEYANAVIDAAETHNIQANTNELLTVMALNYFTQKGVDVVVLEATKGGMDPVNICDAKVATITRVTPAHVDVSDEMLYEELKNMMDIIKPGTHIVSGDQNKSHLQHMHTITNEKGGQWIMPIRKLAALSYPFEQLHGRCAALAERVAQTYMQQFVAPRSTVVKDSLLIKQKGQRGRPTLEAKRQAELHPTKTVEQFWKEHVSALPACFQMLDKEKPSVLLDNASNIDAFKNLLLGIRLLHYQRPLKDLCIIIGAAKHTVHNEEFLKLIRYFFRKTSGQLYICPINKAISGIDEDESWNAEHVANDIKSMKVKAKAFKSFDEAFATAKKNVDDRDGLIVITGSHSIINHYWENKGIKKLQ